MSSMLRSRHNSKHYACFVRGMASNKEDYITDLVCFFCVGVPHDKTMKLNTEAPPPKVPALVFKTPKRILIGEYLIAKPTGFRGSSNTAAKPIYNNTYFVKKKARKLRNHRLDLGYTGSCCVWTTACPAQCLVQASGTSP